LGTNLQEQIWTGFRLAEGLAPGMATINQRKERPRGNGNDKKLLPTFEKWIRLGQPN